VGNRDVGIGDDDYGQGWFFTLFAITAKGEWALTNDDGLIVAFLT